MSAHILPRLATTAEQTEEFRPVYFKVTTRADVSELWWYQRRIYVAFARWFKSIRVRVPPVPPEEQGGLPTFAAADAECMTWDDQISVMPWGWTFERGVIRNDEVCRPRDPADRERYERMREKYRDYDAEDLVMIDRAYYNQLLEGQQLIKEATERMQRAVSNHH